MTSPIMIRILPSLLPITRASGKYLVKSCFIAKDDSSFISSIDIIKVTEESTVTHPTPVPSEMEQHTKLVEKPAQMHVPPPPRPVQNGPERQRKGAEGARARNAYHPYNRNPARAQTTVQTSGHVQPYRQFQGPFAFPPPLMQMNQGGPGPQMPQQFEPSQFRAQQQKFQAPFTAPAGWNQMNQGFAEPPMPGYYGSSPQNLQQRHFQGYYTLPGNPSRVNKSFPNVLQMPGFFQPQLQNPQEQRLQGPNALVTTSMQMSHAPSAPQIPQYQRFPQHNFQQQLDAAPPPGTYNPGPELQKKILNHPLKFLDIRYHNKKLHHSREEWRVNPFTGVRERYIIRQALIYAVPKGHPLYAFKSSQIVLQLGGKPDLQLIDMDYFPGEEPQFTVWYHPANPQQYFYAQNPPTGDQIADPYHTIPPESMDPRMAQRQQLQQLKQLQLQAQPQQMPTPQTTPVNSIGAPKVSFDFFCRTCKRKLQFADGIWNLTLQKAMCYGCQALEERVDVVLTPLELVYEQLVIANSPPKVA